ncbi:MULTISPECIES: 30S ribosomal protein S1 [Oceanobacillus]|uniref:S1 motif domain-containing protein n=1 Tax=Oceanobacillus kimchii TaxID=746691 RepID=A0ABQ5TPG0_9BACI|nr:30S ribosomal protein S1 [Oceanobacillus kimchii]GLO68281.1 hypothetical protein MACH08_40650 [Oceanobacillus kimchii]
MAGFEYVESWETDVELELLTKAKRDNQILIGHVHMLHTLDTSKVENENTIEPRTARDNMELLQIILENGSNVYCTAENFAEYDYRTLRDFVGTQQELIVSDINLETRIALVSVKAADAVNKQKFIERLKTLQERKELASQTFEGIVRGIDPRTNTVYIRIAGVDCRMNPNEWDWSHYYTWEIPDMVQRGEKIRVKVLSYDKESEFVRVSRKATIRDPYERIESLRNADRISGVVTKVHPVHGIFVQIEKGLDAKGMKLRHLPEPVVGDVVTCKVESVNPEKRHVKVMIHRYPNGKSTNQTNPTAFMFGR